jgi:hypothetical protein
MHSKFLVQCLSQCLALLEALEELIKDAEDDGIELTPLASAHSFSLARTSAPT